MTSDFDEDDWRSNENVVALVDSFILAFIRAHPKGEDEAEPDLRKRLRDAKRALFDISPPRGKPDDKDIPELIEIAGRYAELRGGVKWETDWSITYRNELPKGWSITAIVNDVIARRTAKEGAVYHSTHEKVRNLQQKFEAKKDELVSSAIGGFEGSHTDIVQLNFREFHETLVALGIPFDRKANPERDR